jgi:hypothetical protein
MRRLSQAVVGAIALLALVPQPGGAQPLAEKLKQIFTDDNPLRLRNTGHQAHFTSGDVNPTLALLTNNIAYQSSTFPLGSSSGGFTFTLDPTLGTLSRSTESFGPLFAERALTSGRGKLTVGGSYLRNHWERFEGLELEGGGIPFTLRHEEFPGDVYFEGDIVDARFFMDLRTETFAVFANYGVTDRLDVGVAVPFQRVEMNAVVDTTIVPLATGPDAFPAHIFENGTLHDATNVNGDASGVGDVVLRAKLGLAQGDWGGVAAGVDVRLATGDAEDLLGTGSTQVKGFLIVSGGKSKFSPHLNAGYTFTGDSDTLGKLPEELNYAVGFDAAVHPRVTFTADAVGRTLLKADRLVPVQNTYRFRFANEPLGTFPHSVTRDEFAREEGRLNLLLGSVGLKFNPTGRLLLSGNVLISLSKDNGLQDDFTPVFAIDYNF